MGSFVLDFKPQNSNLQPAKPFVGKDGYQNSLGTSSLDTGADISHSTTPAVPTNEVDQASITDAARTSESSSIGSLMGGLMDNYSDAAADKTTKSKEVPSTAN